MSARGKGSADRWKEIRDLAVVVVVALAVAWAVRRMFSGRIPTVELSWSTLAGVALGLLLVFALHEVGHLVAGGVAGLRPLLFAAGPLLVRRGGEGIRVGLNRHVALWGGVAICAPRRTGHGRGSLALMVAGGPLASLVAGALALVAVDPGRILRDGGADTFLDGFLLVLGAGSLVIGLATLLPLGGGFPSDGRRLLQLLWAPEGADGYRVRLALEDYSLEGVRPRDWPPELVRRAAEAGGASSDALLGLHLASAHGWDAGRTEEARGWLRRIASASESLPRPVRAEILLEEAWASARHDGDPARARRLISEVSDGLLTPPWARPLAEAAVACREGRTEDVETALAEVRKGASRWWDPGLATLARARADELESECGPGTPGRGHEARA